MIRVTKSGATIVLQLATRSSFDEFFSIYWEALHECGLEEFSQDVESLIGAVRRAEMIGWDADELRQHARTFDRQVFRERLLEFVGESVAAHAAGARFA